MNNIVLCEPSECYFCCFSALVFITGVIPVSLSFSPGFAYTLAFSNTAVYVIVGITHFH